MTEPDPLPSNLRAVIEAEAEALRGLGPPTCDCDGCRGGHISEISGRLERIARLAWEARGRAEDWQPIAGAPKDGTWLLVTGAWTLPEIAQWCQRGYWQSMDGGPFEPTHWKPLPPAPTSDEPAQEPRR